MILRIASDILSKGLDPTKPHKNLGPDGMLAVPQPVSAQPVVNKVELSVVPEFVVLEPSPVEPEGTMVPEEVPVTEPETEDPPPTMIAAAPTPVELTLPTAPKPQKPGKAKTPKNP